MMRLLHVHSGNLYGGVETMMLTLVRERAAAPAIAPEFALAFDGRLADELRMCGVPVHLLGEVRARYPWSVIRARRGLSRLLAGRAYTAAVCHMPWAHAAFAPAIRRAGVSNIFWMHTPAHGHHWTELRAARTTPQLAICNSRFTAATLPVLFPTTVAEVLHCPVAIPPQRQPAAALQALRRELHTPEGAVVIMQSGRMESLKGHAVLLRALAMLGDRNWVCWQAGGAQRHEEASYLERLKLMARESGIAERVKFLGHRSDVAALLEAADVYCQPNTAPEAFGISLVEALGAALPVVTSALGGALEIVDESCGILVAPNDPGALAAAIARLIDDGSLRRRLGAAGPPRAVALCDPPAIMRRLGEMVGRISGLAVGG